METKEVACEAASAEEWRAQRSEQLKWMEERRRVSEEVKQMLSEHKVLAEAMKRTLAEERLQLNEQREAMEVQRKADAGIRSACEAQRDEDIRRIAEATAALMQLTEGTKRNGSDTVPMEGAHVLPSNIDVGTYADALSKPLGGRREKVVRREEPTPVTGAGTLVKCMRCGERGHGHWTCFGDVHESRLWGRDWKKRRKRWRGTNMDVKVVTETMKTTPGAVNGVAEMEATCGADRMGRGCGGMKSSGDNKRVTAGLKADEHRRGDASGEITELEEVALNGTADGRCRRGDCSLPHITDQGGCVGSMV